MREARLTDGANGDTGRYVVPPDRCIDDKELRDRRANVGHIQKLCTVLTVAGSLQFCR